MIEPPAKHVTISQAIEWMIRALRDEGLPILLCGRSALDFQGEHTGSTDIDILIGTDYRGALTVLDAYADRGDLVCGLPVPGQVTRYLVRGFVAVDLLNVTSIHPRLYDLLWSNASASIDFGGEVGDVRATNREGYFVLAVMLGLHGFPKGKADPMRKVRESWAMFGDRTDRAKVENLLAQLGEPGALGPALEEPGRKTGGT